jgi:hypothetical protein
MDAEVATGKQVDATVISGVGNGFDRLESKRFPGFHRHLRQLSAIDDLIGDLVGDDVVMLGFDRGLHIVADDAGKAMPVTLSLVSGSVSETWPSGDASIAASKTFNFCIWA